MNEMVKARKERYPTGTRIELLYMNDPYSPVHTGTKGTVVCVDDMGQIHGSWGGCALIPGVDEFEVIG